MAVKYKRSQLFSLERNEPHEYGYYSSFIINQLNYERGNTLTYNKLCSILKFTNNIRVKWGFMITALLVEEPTDIGNMTFSCQRRPSIGFPGC